jgi:hypothetical protein
MKKRTPDIQDGVVSFPAIREAEKSSAAKWPASFHVSSAFPRSFCPPHFFASVTAPPR